MTTRIAIICAPNKFSAKIQAFGERINGRPVHPAYPYHAAWVTDNAMYDMNFKFRKISLDSYSKRDVRIFESPADVSEDYLEFMVGKRSYGVFDVSLNPVLTPLGINAPGTHCMEAINDDLWFHGYRTPFLPYGTPPTPHQGLFWLESL